MSFLTQPDFWVRWLQIVLIDLVLAGDNALVIALAVRTLRPREQFWGRIWGTAGAVILRLAFIATITLLLRVPLLQLAGGVVLIWIAIKLVRPGHAEEGPAHAGASVRDAIKIIIVADVAMSLDNVIAIAGAAKGDLILVTFGLLLSLPLVVWGSGLLARLMNRFRWIVWLGGGVLGYVAGEMILKDPWVIRWLGSLLSSLYDIGPLAIGLFAAFLGGPLTIGFFVAFLGGWWARGAAAKNQRSE